MYNATFFIPPPDLTPYMGALSPSHPLTLKQIHFADLLFLSVPVSSPSTFATLEIWSLSQSLVSAYASLDFN